MYKNIYKYTSHVSRGPSVDVSVMVELASKIQDLLRSESCELLAHGVNPINRQRFHVDLRHLSFLKRWIYINSPR